MRRSRAERRRERWRVVGHLLWMALALALPAFSVVAVGAPIWARLGACLALVVAWMFIRSTVVRCCAAGAPSRPGPPSPSPPALRRAAHRPCAPGAPLLASCARRAQREQLPRSHLVGQHLQGHPGARQNQVLAEGQGPATLQISPFGPPTFDEAGLSIEHELRFFHPDRPDDVVITQLTVAPGRVA
ncbi:MAG: hypothetical protein IPI35_31815 [Deltaproteobacteria bacterium]|nr:hypothetical protein [Deltaproteobacteria bacterium]